MIAFSSDMETCLALSTAVTTCCWCWKANNMHQLKFIRYELISSLTSWDKKGKSCAMIPFNRLAISIWNEFKRALFTINSAAAKPKTWLPPLLLHALSSACSFISRSVKRSRRRRRLPTANSPNVSVRLLLLLLSVFSATAAAIDPGIRIICSGIFSLFPTTHRFAALLAKES